MKAWLKRDLRRTELVVAIIVVVLIAFRLALPAILKHEINQRLANIADYDGHVDDVGVHLLHGGYSMHRLVVKKKGARGNEPFVNADDIRFTIAYRDLLHGRFTSDIVITRGVMNFETGASPQAKQNLGSAKTAAGVPKPARPWQDAFKDLFPIKIGHLELIDSRIHYLNKSADPPVNLSIDHLELTANGLRTRPDPQTGPLPATITANGRTIGGGHFHLEIKVEPLVQPPHFTLKLALEQVDLTALNPFLLHSADVDVGRGTLEVYTEINASGGNYQGYVKPMLTNLDFHNRKDEQRPPLQLLWKDIVAAVTRLLRDKQQKQVATVIPFSGKFATGSNIGVGATVRTLFYNGFVQALRRGLESNPAVAKKGG
ncbi:MAG TPA: DUF748 domain-containing protein [Opitutaceae bacterium]|nr:DUF748 domain-containing protein [Opitutaceae bacterium]